MPTDSPRPHDPLDSLDRREAIRRVALLIGGAAAAPSLAAILAACDQRSAAGAWTPRALTPAQGELVAVVVDHIVPRTDTPGARDAGVHRFIDTMYAEYQSRADRERLDAGLADLDARANARHRRAFADCATADQRAILEAIDHESYATPDPGPRREIPWFRTIKELTLLGYYTSEAGATKELRYVAVPGRYDGCVPFASVGRTWAV